jgi:hypothetical protein
LKDLVVKVEIEIVRLGASGTTDQNTQSRIGVLNYIKQNISDLVADVESNVRTIDSIKLTKDDIRTFLPTMSNPDSALPDILDKLDASSLFSTFNSLFPVYKSGDVSGSQLSKALLDKYMKDVTQNLSWNVELNYTGKAQQEVAANYASAMRDARYAVDNTGTPTASNSSVDATNSAGPVNSSYRGLFESVISSMTGGGTKVSVNLGDGGSTTGAGAGAGAGADAAAAGAPGFDWKARSKQICSQINMRGMNAYDFGCLKEDAKISDDFSWRGYSRMICTRLATMYDPSIPDLCGCPPPTWIGWRP